MKWSTHAWKTSESVYIQILELPFIQELMDGSLPRDKFYCYLQQDAIYLSEYGKILAGIASKLNNQQHREAFLHFSTDTILVESALHKSYLKDAPKPSNAVASPSCMLYTGFLSKQLCFYPIETALAAILPCFWIYHQVGKYIVAHQSKENNPYQTWIQTYGNKDFEVLVNLAIAICDEVAINSEIRADMTETFLMASKMEWIFWDSAYRLEKWPV